MAPTTSYQNGKFSFDLLFPNFSRRRLKYDTNAMLTFYRVDWEESVIKIHTNDRNSSTLNSNESTIISQTREMFLLVYACIMVLGTFCFLSRSFSFYRMCYRVSINFHDMIFRGVTRARMIFFNNNQSGRVLNRFARDINSIDSLLPNMMVDVFDVSIPEVTFFDPSLAFFKHSRNLMKCSDQNGAMYPIFHADLIGPGKCSKDLTPTIPRIANY